MSQKKALYRIQFINNGKNYQLYVRELASSAIFGFIEIGDFVFDNQSSLLVDPSEEKLKSEFSEVVHTLIPLHSVIRIDKVSTKGSARISDLEGNVMSFPYITNKK